MARLARIEYEGAIYHVTVRGNNRRSLFVDDRDRRRFVERLGDYAEECDIRIYAFCLMPNHVHLVAETPHANLRQFMHKLETGYTVYYNQRHQECGHLTQGRYGAKAVEGDAYLLSLARYVHLNPIYAAAIAGKERSERVRILRNYRWSSYRAYLGKKEWGFIEDMPLLAMMEGRNERRRRVAFRRFVESGLTKADDEFLSVYQHSRLGIGGEEFLEQLEARYEAAARQRKKMEDVALRRVGYRLPASQVVEIVCRYLRVEPGEERCRRRESWVRPVISRMLTRYSGLTQREIAACLGVATGKSVSEQMQRLAVALPTNQTLAKVVSRLESVLGAARNGAKHHTQG